MSDTAILTNNLFEQLFDSITKVQEVEYCMLNAKDEMAVKEAAECLAEAFTGVEIRGTKVYEPMVYVSNLSPKSMFEFTLGYIKNIADQGFCYIARDKATGKVIGAFVCESFNPEEELPVYDGDLLPMNKIISFLGELDAKFLETIYQKTGKEAAKDEYIHGFMCGGRNTKNRGMIIVKLIELLIRKASELGYKGLFVEATNKRSSKLVLNSMDFNLVHDKNNKPILLKYADYDDFKAIPPNVSEDCKILYKAFRQEYEL